MGDITTREATAQETAAWTERWLERAETQSRRIGLKSRAEGLKQRREKADEAVLLRLLDGDTPVGCLSLLVVTEDGRRAVVEDIEIDEPLRRRGYGSAALRYAREWAAGRAPRLSAGIDPSDPAQVALFAEMPVRAQNMYKTLGEAPELPSGVTARQMTEDEFRPWWQAGKLDYAESFVRNGILTEEEARERSERDHAQLLPEGLDTEGSDVTAIVADGRRVAAIWTAHGVEPAVSFVYSVDVEAGERGRGYGRAAMLAAERLSLAAGSTRLGLNVFGHNDVAIKLYDSLGYETTSQMRGVDL
ncbi:MAG: GNAT family N-acetyltransferase [Hamadaea sp.]|nr:GNAT family N-acetyltransferase [Hamadaea sp.]